MFHIFVQMYRASRQMYVRGHYVFSKDNEFRINVITKKVKKSK